jgi:hypothetical protein
MRQTFDDYNENCEMIDGYAATHPHNVGLLMLRGISNTCHFGQAKQCVINAFDTNYLLSADQVMANIIHLTQNMDEELPAPALPYPDGPTPPNYAFVAVDRGSNSERERNPRGTRGGRGVPNKCNACGSVNHIMSPCTTSDNALLKWTLAKRKMIVQKHGTHGGSVSTHAALLSDVSTDDPHVMPTLKECTDEYDDNEVSVPVNYVPFSYSLVTSLNFGW